MLARRVAAGLTRAGPKAVAARVGARSAAVQTAGGVPPPGPVRQAPAWCGYALVPRERAPWTVCDGRRGLAKKAKEGGKGKGKGKDANTESSGSAEPGMRPLARLAAPSERVARGEADPRACVHQRSCRRRMHTRHTTSCENGSGHARHPEGDGRRLRKRPPEFRL